MIHTYRKSSLQPFTNDFPRADIYEMMSPDILHQIIKGAFKDHLVKWVNDYLEITHGKARADEIRDEIDDRSVLPQCFLVLTEVAS